MVHSLVNDKGIIHLTEKFTVDIKKLIKKANKSAKKERAALEEASGVRIKLVLCLR